jgi:hypothetical protein
VTDPRVGATPDDEAPSPGRDHATSEVEARSAGRGRQILLVFLVIAVATIAVMQFHALVPGMDQLVAVTPVVLIVVVGATIWLLFRQGRRRP